MTASGSEIRIILVGGNPEQRSLIQRQLGAIGGVRLSVELSTAWSETLQRLEHGACHVVLIGWEIAVSDPRGIFEQIHKASPGVPVIVFGGKDELEKDAQLVRLGAADVVASNELVNGLLSRSIRMALERSKSQAPQKAPRSQPSPYQTLSNNGVCALLGLAALEQSLDGIFAYDTNFRYIAWNPAMERIFGLRESEVLGRNAVEVLPFLEDVDEEEFFTAARQGKVVTSHERPYIVPRSSRRGLFESFYSPIKSSTGEIVAVLGIMRDTSENDRAQIELHESEERFKRMADVVPSLVWMSGKDGQRIFFNKRWLEFTGRSADQEMGTGYMRNFHPQDIQRFVDLYTKAVAAQQDFHIEYRVRRHDGQFRWILDTGSPLITREGNLIGYVGLCADISETRMTQNRIDAALRDRKEPPPSTVENAPIGIWKLDNEFHITKANATVAKQLAMEPGQFMGRKLPEIVTSLPTEVLASVLSRGERFHLENQPIVRGDAGTPCGYWDVAVWPLKGEHNAIVGVCMSTMEVTERQRLLQQKEDFIATLVHDLKTPLIGADKTLESLMNGALGIVDSGQVNVLSMLKRSNQQLLSMVQNLIEVYRFDSDTSQFTFETTDLKELLVTCTDELAALAKQRGIKLIMNVPEMLPSVKGDRLALRRVFLNLLDNALKFTPRDGVIEVFAEQSGDSVTTHVRDSGIGIPPEEQSKLFQRFWQGERGKRYAVGTGLGLYLCREIITAHRGQITVTSAENEGTTFTVRLPTLPSSPR